MSETEELANKLNRRQQINQGELQPESSQRSPRNVYADNPDMSKQTLDSITSKFEQYDEDKNGILDMTELTRLFEKLGAPQTVTSLKGLIRRVDEDGDGCVNLREFVSIFRIPWVAASEHLDESSPLRQLALLSEVDVGAVGVKGARDFFIAKSQATVDGDFAKQMADERAEKQRAEEDRKQRAAKMKALKSQFEGGTA